MVAFNPSTGTNEQQASSQLGYSQGTGVDRSFETLFSGLGDLVGGAAKAVDTGIQTKIEREARYGYESTNDEMNLSTTTAPPEITRTNEGLQKLASAHMQGKITSEYYYGRLAASLKGLRARYPGYESQVDNIVQNVTGVNPANAYRNALLQNIDNQAQAQASTANKEQQWASTSEVSEVLGIIAPDYWTNPEKYSSPDAKAQLRSDVSAYQGRTRLAEDTTKLMNANKEVAKPQLGSYLNTIASGYVVGTGEAANVNSPNVQNLITKALADGSVDQNEKDEINGFIASQRSSAEAKMRQEFATKEWSGNFNSREREDEIKNALAIFDNMSTLVNNDQISQAAQIASRNKAQLDQSVAKVYEQYPELQAAGAIRQIAGDNASQALVDNLVQSVGGGPQFLKTLTPNSKIVTQDATKAVVQGEMNIDRMSDALLGMAGKPSAERQAMVSATLDGVTSLLSKPGAPPEVVKNTVMNTYGTKLDGIWSKVDNSTGPEGLSQRSRLFNKMFSPEITKQVASLNDPEALQTYTAAAADKFQQIPEFRRAAASLSQDLPYARYAKVAYDPQRNRMVVSVNKEALGNAGFFTRNDQSAINQNLVPFVNSVNQALSVMAPIIEASGVDEAEGVGALFEQLNLNLNEGRQTGIFGYISQSVDQAIETLASPAGQGGQTDSKVNASDPTQTGTFEELDGQPVELDDDEISWNLPADTEDLGGALAYAGSTGGDSGAPFDAVLKAGKGYTVIQRPDGSVVRRSGARNWRNNNPGNIEYGAFAKAQGAIGTDGRFAVFPSYEQGRTAKAALIFEGKGYRDKSIAGVISRYAPSFENDTGAYTAAVARAVGVSPDTPVQELTPAQRTRMLNAMERVEGFKVGREVAMSE